MRADGSYAVQDVGLTNTETREWTHPLGEIVTALIDAGIRIEFVHEFAAQPAFTAGGKRPCDGRYGARKPFRVAGSRSYGHDGRVPSLVTPRTRLDDDVIGLRPFRQDDLPAFEAAARPGGNEGTWLTMGGRENPQEALDDHLDGRPGTDPPELALAIVTVADDTLAGEATFAIRAEDSVELAYGVAPAHRGQGVATRTAKLAASWLLDERGWGQVELRIADEALASQRVAAKAGFHPAGRVRTWVPGVGREFEDRLYLKAKGHIGPLEDGS